MGAKENKMTDQEQTLYDQPLNLMQATFTKECVTCATRTHDCVPFTETREWEKNITTFTCDGRCPWLWLVFLHVNRRTRLWVNKSLIVKQNLNYMLEFTWSHFQETRWDARIKPVCRLKNDNCAHESYNCSWWCLFETHPHWFVFHRLIPHQPCRANAPPWSGQEYVVWLSLQWRVEQRQMPPLNLALQVKSPKN